MKVDGRSIVITDPCYISKDEHWGKEFNYDDCCISLNLKCFSDYIMEDTGEGDGTWEVYMTGKREPVHRLTKLIDSLYREEDYSDKLIGESIGEYSADAGISGVFFLDEVNEYGPSENIDDLVERGCAVIIHGFVGEVNEYFDESGILHFIGIGNKSFYTA